MRKLLILMLVLGLGSYASAGLTWTVTGSTGPTSTDVNPGDNLTLDLVETGDNVVSIVIDTIGDGDPTGAVFTSSTVHAGFNVIAVPGMSTGVPVPVFDAFLTGYAYPPSGLPLDDWAWIDVLSTLAPPPAGIVLSLGYTAGGIGTYNIVGSIYGPPLGGAAVVNEQVGGASALPGLTITVIPEPMTMVLLGLGGLFLRRRK